MSSVARQLREEQIRETLGMTPDERIALLLRLNEEALHFFMAARGLTRERAIAEIRKTRRLGRRPSKCMDGEE